MGTNQSKQTNYFEYSVGETICLTVENKSKKIEWLLNEKTILLSDSGHYEKTNATFQDSGIYKCKLDDEVIYEVHVDVYDYLIDKFLGIRWKIKEARSDEESKRVTSVPSTCNKVVPLNNTSKSTKLTKGSKTSEETANPPESTGKPVQTYKIVEDYTMTSETRGIAVLVVIEEFAYLKQLPALHKDIETCKQTYGALNFEVKECKHKDAANILQYLKDIARLDHSKYDCFVLHISTHGGEGFVCCKDFATKKLREDAKKKKKKKGKKTKNEENENMEKEDEKQGAADKTAKGYLLYETIIEIFINKNCSTLENKPKLFFFDSCRSINNSIVKTVPQAPIRVIDTYNKRDEGYADILLGYAALPTNNAYCDENGSKYTNVLRDCLKPSDDEKTSLADRMVAVDNRMKIENANQFSNHKSYLRKRVLF